PVGAGLPEPMLDALVQATEARRPVSYEVDLATWERRLGEATQSGLDGDLFRTAYAPPLRMLIVGAVHIAQHLVPMARACGWAPVVIDPRPVFGAQDRFPGEAIVEDWPDEALEALGVDARTAVVTLTHDPKLDDPAIRAALAGDVLYLGCLGSTRTHAKRLARMEGLPTGRIHAPVGLAIGARSPAEIAVSIMAQVTQVLRA
ncbi:MAG: XdhC family protein, partial [Shimia sp.]